jgi:phage N-6-adenine-methyltransferase
MKADINKLAYIGAKPGTKSQTKRDSDSWFTPSMYTDMAREVMGEIDLDPFSSKTANEHIKAKRYFDIKSDAFKQEWFRDQGRVFMNPPYGRKLIDASIDIFLTNLSNDSISQAIVLVNNATETRWFHSLLNYTDAICFPDRRIAFETDDGKHVSGNTRGQVFFYFGHKVDNFEDIFGKIGAVLKPSSKSKT